MRAFKQKLKTQSDGFTIVELLIAIVVIAILATLAVTAYGNVSAMSHDSAVKSDLANIAKKIRAYEVDNGVYPAGNTQLTTLGLRVSKQSYGNHYNNGASTYNLVYCRMPATAPTSFALVAFSVSGKNFMYSSTGRLVEYTGPKTGSAAICTAAGIPITGAFTERDWFFDAGTWQSFAGS